MEVINFFFFIFGWESQLGMLLDVGMSGSKG